MIRLPEEALDCFRTHHGMATGSMLAVAGVSRRSRQRAVDDGLFEVWYERVFRIRSAPLTLEARCAALCMAHPRGFITGPTGGRLRGLRRMPRLADVQFAHPHGAHIGPYPGVKRRDRQCHRIGWQVERVTELDLLDFDGLCDELADLYHDRCRLVA